MTYNIGMKYVVCTGVRSHLVVLLFSLAEVLRNKIFYVALSLRETIHLSFGE